VIPKGELLLATAIVVLGKALCFSIKDGKFIVFIQAERLSIA